MLSARQVSLVWRFKTSSRSTTDCARLGHDRSVDRELLTKTKDDLQLVTYNRPTQLCTWILDDGTIVNDLHKGKKKNQDSLNLVNGYPTYNDFVSLLVPTFHLTHARKRKQSSQTGSFMSKTCNIV